MAPTVSARRGRRTPYQELLDASREVAVQTWPTCRPLVDALSIACLHAEVGEWERAEAELVLAEGLAPAGARHRLRDLRLRAAHVEAHRHHDARWSSPRREA